MVQWLDDFAAYMPPQALAYWLFIFTGILWGTLFPSLSGMILNPVRPLQNPMNMPFDGCKLFDLTRFDYNQLQKVRHCFGYIMSFFLTVAGYYGCSGMLAYEPALERYARFGLLLPGLVSFGTHFQFNWERYHNGVQMIKSYGLLWCAAGNFLSIAITYFWLIQVERVVSPEVKELRYVQVGAWGTNGTLFLLNLIRLYSFIHGGPKEFFEPLVPIEGHQHQD